jgi:C-terminal domain of Type VI secretion system FHA protein/FHA domain
MTYQEKGSLGLRVLVHNEADGSTTDLLFSQFPVRIGRNSLNDLVLNHQYVSQWHAVFQLENQVLSIVQVGSSNSVQVGDYRMSTDEELPLEGDQVVRIIPFGLTVQLVTVPQSMGTRELSKVYVQGTGTGQQELEQIALEVLDRLANHFLGMTLRSAGEVATFGARLEKTLDVFLRFFVALQKGQEQFREAFDIRALRSEQQNPIEQATDATALAGLLLQSSGAVKSLEHASKNVMIHQVALLNGLMAGVRTLLAKLSPKMIMKEAKKSHRSPSAKVLWQTFELIHQDFAEEDNETFETIFGSQFSKAYSALLGKKADRQAGRTGQR